MDGVTLTLERTDESTLPYVEDLLTANELPTEDLEEKPACFYVAFDGEDRVGVGGLERHGSEALLRSLVVERHVRDSGLGTAICEALEQRARADGVETVYLLTTTAAAFFASLGYAEIDRTGVPAAIQQTAQFEELCPTSATCMKKSLERSR